MGMYTALLKLGVPVDNSGVIVSKALKKGSPIPSPGDVIVLVQDPANSGFTTVEKASTSNTASGKSCLYGIALQGAMGGMIPIMLSGRCTINIDTGVFTAATVGKGLATTADPKCHCCVIESEIKVQGKDGKTTKGYIALI